MNDLDTSVLDREETFSQADNDRIASDLYGDSVRSEVTEIKENENGSQLVDEEDSLTSKRNIKKSKWLQLSSALIVASIVAIPGFFIFWTFGKIASVQKQQPVEEVQNQEGDEQQERIIELQHEVDRKNAILAFDERDTSDWEEINEPEAQAVEVVQPVSTQQPTRTPSPTVASASTSNSNQNRQQPKITNTDPLEKWARLASLGTANGENTTEIIETVSEFREDNTSPQKQPSRVNRSSIAKTIPTSPTSQTPKTPNLGIPRGEVAQIASINIGKAESESEARSAQSEEITNLLNDTPQKNSYLEEKRRQYEREDRLGKISSPVDSGSSTIALEENLRRSNTQVIQENTAITSSKKVPLGNSVIGELNHDLVLTPEQKGTRGIIYLSEPLLADDGTTALDENSAIIVEIKSISNSGLVELEAVAISYENSSGVLIQEALPPRGILLQGNKEALIAERINGSGGSNFGQDLLLAGLGAGKKAFEIVNEPERTSFGRRGFDVFDIFDNSELDSDDFGRYSYNDFRTRRSNDASLLTGAAEGAFETTKDRLERRSQQIEQERQNDEPIYRIKAGTEVLVFINSFLTIEQ